MKNSLPETQSKASSAANGAQPQTGPTEATTAPRAAPPLARQTQQRPAPLLYKADLAGTLPAELTARPQWVAWRYKWVEGQNGKPGRWTKVPYNARTGAKAASTGATTWSTFDEAIAAHSTGKYSGIGFVLTPDDPIVGIDLDHCCDPDTGTVYPWAMNVVQRFGSYAEISPSGEGVRIFLVGVLPPGRRKETKQGIEMYDRERFLTLTGNNLEGYSSLEDGSAELAEWHAEVFPEVERPQQRPFVSLSLDDEKIIEKARKAKNGAAFDRLFTGDAGAYPSASEADLGLLGYFKFYTQNAAQLERLWRSSSLWRDKAEKRPAYVAETIETALENVTATYDPAYHIGRMMNGTAPKIRRPRQPAPAQGGASAPPTIEVAPATVSEQLPPAEREFALDCLEAEEAGDAELFAHLYEGGRVLFDHAAKTWHLWNGHHYRPDLIGIMRRLVPGQLAAQYLHHAAELTREAEAEGEAGAPKRGQADRLIKRAKQLRKLQRIDNILKLAQSWLGISGSEWDARPDLLGVKNGVLELPTGTLRAGRPDDRIRTVAPVEWRGLNEPAPRWEQFVCEIFGGDVELPGFLRRLLGCGIYGAVAEHVLPILWGEGRNGKDTLLETLAAVLGPGAGAVSADVLVADKAARGGAATPHLVAFQGRRLAWASETNEGARLNAGQVKLVTGGGSISARQVYGKQIEFAPSHLLLLITNHRPHAPADDYALWKRLLLLPFTQKFVDDPRAPDEHERDPHLKEKLEAEAPGILAWLVRGYLEWKRDGLKPPAAVQAATAEYQREEDTLADFVEACCIEAPHATVRAAAWFKTYQRWAEETNQRPLGSKTFYQKMQKRYTRAKDEHGYYYAGIGISENAPSAPSAPSMSQNGVTAPVRVQTSDTQGAEGAEGAAEPRERGAI